MGSLEPCHRTTLGSLNKSFVNGSTKLVLSNVQMAQIINMCYDFNL